MDKLLKNAFKMQIQSKEGFEFEEFIDELFLLKYGVDNYTPIRRNKDKGNDGTILPEQKYWLVTHQENIAKLILKQKF
jgi:hypothetical protein